MVLFLDFGLHGFLGHCRWIQEGSSFQCGSKVWKGYQRRVKNVMSIISLNFADNQLTHIKSCKRPVDAWKTLCNIHKTKKLSNIFFVCRKFFTYNIQEGDDLLNHINKLKAFVDQIALFGGTCAGKKTSS